MKGRAKALVYATLSEMQRAFEIVFGSSLVIMILITRNRLGKPTHSVYDTSAYDTYVYKMVGNGKFKQIGVYTPKRYLLDNQFREGLIIDIMLLAALCILIMVFRENAKRLSFIFDIPRETLRAAGILGIVILSFGGAAYAVLGRVILRSGQGRWLGGLAKTFMLDTVFRNGFVTVLCDFLQTFLLFFTVACFAMLLEILREKSRRIIILPIVGFLVGIIWGIILKCGGFGFMKPVRELCYGIVSNYWWSALCYVILSGLLLVGICRMSMQKENVYELQIK